MLGTDKQVLQIQSGASPSRVVAEEQREAGGRTAPFGDQGAELWMLAEPIARNDGFRSQNFSARFSYSASSEISSLITGTSSTLAVRTVSIASAGVSRRNQINTSNEQVENAALVVGWEGPLFMQLTIPLSRGGNPLHKQIYAGLRSAVFSGKLASGARLPSTRDLADNCAFLARLSWRRTTNCWPKVSLLAAVVQEHMLQRDCLLVDSLGARSLQGFGYRVLGALLPMLLSLWRARDDNLITGTTSSSDGARVTSRLFRLPNGTSCLRDARGRRPSPSLITGRQPEILHCGKPSALICGVHAPWPATPLRSSLLMAPSKLWI